MFSQNKYFNDWKIKIHRRTSEDEMVDIEEYESLFKNFENMLKKKLGKISWLLLIKV